jgi:Fur family transcriptional regulator, zinc uptake regulator
VPTSVSLEKLKSKGYKLTEQRRRIIEVLRRENRRMSAREIHALLQHSQPKISLDTVYRNLRLLVGLEIIHQISLQAGAVFEISSVLEHHHHLVCLNCEKVVCIPYCPDISSYGEQAKQQGFTVHGHTFEVYGQCSSCRQQKKPIIEN